MKIKMTLPAAVAALALLSTLNLQFSTAFAQGTTAFTYQGQLRDGGTNANGVYTLIFKLYDAANGGNQIGGTLTTAPTLANGLFTVNLDFGAGAFDGNGRWLDITVQSGLDTQPLTPRVPVEPSPYALYAGTSASAASLSSSGWTSFAGTYQGMTNVFGIFDNNNLVLGMSADGSVINGHLDVNGVDVHGEIDQVDSLNFNNGASISGGDGGGFNFNGNLGDISAGNINADRLNLNSDLNVNGNILLFGTNGVSGIYSDGNGGFTFADGATGINRMGPIWTYYGLNVNSGTAVISANGNISCMWVNGFGINVTNGISCSYLNCSGVASAQSYVTTSDRNLKEKFAPVDSLEVLERVASLPITSWNFKNDSTRHLGPMAQDFYSAFNVGPDDKHIATVDEGGVALAAIQGLNQKLNQKDAELQQLKLQNESLEKRLAELEALVKLTAGK